MLNCFNQIGKQIINLVHVCCSSDIFVMFVIFVIFAKGSERQMIIFSNILTKNIPNVLNCFSRKINWHKTFGSSSAGTHPLWAWHVRYRCSVDFFFGIWSRRNFGGVECLCITLYLFVVWMGRLRRTGTQKWIDFVQHGNMWTVLRKTNRWTRWLRVPDSELGFKPVKEMPKKNDYASKVVRSVPSLRMATMLLPYISHVFWMFTRSQGFWPMTILFGLLFLVLAKVWGERSGCEFQWTAGGKMLPSMGWLRWVGI